MNATPRPLPRIVEASPRGASLVEWGRSNAAELRGEIDAAGALLFRGFSLDEKAGFREFVDAVSEQGPLDYVYQSTPRTAVADKIYTATEYPATQTIPLHNENAYQRSWPMRLFFQCVIAAKTGGETPIADTARVTERIEPGIRERFEKLGVAYVRNYRKGLDLPWQKVFQTEDKGAVSRFCEEHGIEVEWRANDALRTRHVCQAFATHPRTGQRVWMNQAHLFHVSSLDQRTRESLLTLFKPEDLPRNSYYGDGSAIEPEVLEHVRDAFRVEEVSFPWQAGDVLVVDNMLVSHGRRPFTGERRVLVAMAEPYAPS